jgi:endonuclease/exonuclease/phosphatase family metal-dependent hydrolase
MGVISRYPLVQNIRQRLPQPRSLPFLSSLFRPYHTVQMVDVQCGHQTIRLLHVHLDAHDAATRQQQARELLAFVRQVETPTSVLMGAFNAALPEAAGVSTDADAARDQTMDIIITGLRGRFRIVTDNGLTSAATTPRARLEHVLTGSGLRAPEAHVIPLREPISEHLPVVVRLRWALPLMVSNGRSAHERL